MSDQSLYRLVSKGIVLQDKDPKTSKILVDPIEKFTLDNGELKPFERNVESTYVNKDGKQKKAKVEAGSGIEATWVAVESNRETAPDVCKGETVDLYQFGDDPKYYWTSAGREPELRGKETVRFSYSNKDYRDRPYDNDTSYWMEFDTRGKKVRIHTSDNDGESTTWDIDIDTAAGVLNIRDGRGQFIDFNSPEGRIEVVTQEEIKLRSKRIVLEAEDIVNESTSYMNNTQSHTTTTKTQNVYSDMITHTAEVELHKVQDEVICGDMHMNRGFSVDGFGFCEATECQILHLQCRYILLEAFDLLEFKSPERLANHDNTTENHATLKLTASSSLEVSSPSATLNLNTVNQTSSQIGITTDLLTFTSGNTEITSPMSITGDVNVTGDLLNTGRNSNTHTHDNYASGSSVSALSGRIEALEAAVAELQSKG